MIARFLLILLLAASVSADAQFAPGQVLTASQLNNQLSQKASTSDLAGTGDNQGAALLGFKNSPAGAQARSVQSKLADVVSVTDFPNVDKTCATDSTSGLQAAINSGAKGVYIPTGCYKYSTLVMPVTVGFVFYGDGVSSILTQTGSGIKWPSRPSTVLDSQSTIRDLTFNGEAGTGNTIDASFVQTIDFLNLRFDGIPTGFSSLKLDGNPNDGTYMHDVRVKNIRIYNFTNNGKAGIELGGYASDTAIDGFIMNGGFVTDYCLYANVNAQTTVLSNSHPYNAKINVVKLAGNNGDFGWDNVIFDNALADIFYSTGSVRGRFSHVFFQAIPAGYSGVVYDNSYNNTVTNFGCWSSSGTRSCGREVNGSSGNKFAYGNVDTVGNYSSVFDLTGGGSIVTGVQNVDIASPGKFSTLTATGAGVFSSIAAAGSILSSGASSGVGYAAGAGGAATQATSKTTGVTLNTPTGRVSLNSAALADATTACFTLTNSAIAAADIVLANIASGATAGAYLLNVDAVAAGSARLCLSNRSGATLSEPVVLNYALVKGSPN